MRISFEQNSAIQHSKKSAEVLDTEKRETNELASRTLLKSMYDGVEGVGASDVDHLIKKFFDFESPNQITFSGVEEDRGLSFQGMDGLEIPDGLFVQNDLDVRNTDLESIPRSLQVNGTAFVAGCSKTVQQQFEKLKEAGSVGDVSYQEVLY